MNQQPDKFFRDKLQGYQKPAPESAWERIAASQHKKKRKGFWLEIAATLLMLATVTYILSPSTDQTDEIAQHIKEKVDAPAQRQPDANPSKQPTPTNIEQQRDQTRANNPQSKKKPSDVPRVKEQVVEDEVQHNPMATAENNDLYNKSVQLESIVEINEKQNVSEGDQTQPLTLVYTANDVSKYLDKKALAEATSEEKKPSTLKKLLRKANDLKTNQDPFGELRQKKNEILALNFKNDKQRGQNK